MSSKARLEKFGVALLATRGSVLGYDPCGGSEVVLWGDVAILRDAGIPVRVYGRAARNGAPVSTLPIHADLPLLGSLEYCGRLLWKEREAFVMAYNEPTVAGLIPQRSIVEFDWTTPLPRYWKLPGWISRFRRALYVFPSNSERQLFLQKHPLIPQNAAVILPYRLDLALFKPAEHGARHPLRVGFAGQWLAGKGISPLLEAWKIVKGEFPAAELWVAGGAQLYKVTYAIPGAREAAGLIGAMERGGLLHVVGELRRAEMPAFWNSVDIAVVPSLTEAFGLVALEALACGVPVVASAVGGLVEIVVDGECGLLVQPNNPKQLAEALIGLLSNAERRCRLAEGTRRRATMWSVERRSQELLGLMVTRVEALRSK